MALPAERDLAQLEKDFLSGKNPLAYIPLCHSLRRQKSYAKALEICQRGLAGDPNSVAGRTLFARLLADVGRYEDALAEIARAEARAPDAAGLLAEKCRCLAKLHRYGEAEQALDALSVLNPMDPQAQALRIELRRIQNTRQSGVAPKLDRAGASPRILKMESSQVLQALMAEMKPLAKITSCAVIPMGAGAPALDGFPEPAETAYSFFKECLMACQELDRGSIRMGIIETTEAQLIVLARRDYLVSFCMQPTANLGKVLYRLQLAASRLMPGADEPTGPGEDDTQKQADAKE